MRLDVQNDTIKLISDAGDATYLAVDVNNLELYATLSSAYVETATDRLVLTPWSNPKVDTASMTRTQLLLAAYLTALTFLKIRDTRDVWMAFPTLPNSMLSYILGRATSSASYIMPYKVAILQCLYRRYTLKDLDAIRNTFEDNGLHGENAVLYLIFIMSGNFRELKVDASEPFHLCLNTLTQEANDFISTPSISRLAHYRAHTQLTFIAKSHNIDVNELASDLMMQTLVAYRIARPCHTRPYSENYARRAMTNIANRIIYAHTHYDSKINIKRDAAGDFISRFAPVPNIDVLHPTSEVYDFSQYRESLLFNEDTMIDRIDQKRVKYA